MESGLVNGEKQKRDQLEGRKSKESKVDDAPEDCLPKRRVGVLSSRRELETVSKEKMGNTQTNERDYY